MLDVDVPGFGHLKLQNLVSDYNGTLALDGSLPKQVKVKLNQVATRLQIYVVTSDEFGKAKEELNGVNCTLRIIEEKAMDKQKAEFVQKLGAEGVVAFGNGMNDRGMLKAARLGIAILGGEGCAVEAALAADVQVANAVDGLDLLLNPKRLRATLKF